MQLKQSQDLLLLLQWCSIFQEWKLHNMGIALYPVPSGAKELTTITLTSGTSWTVPSGVTFINACLTGGAGSTGGSNGSSGAQGGTTTMTGATSAVGGPGSNPGSATSVAAAYNDGGVKPGGWGNGSPGIGSGGNGYSLWSSFATTPGASISYAIGAGGTSSNNHAVGGAGKIDIEYWS
jgi:hypothetical protein